MTCYVYMQKKIELNLLSCDLFDKITDTNDITNATTAIAAIPLINVKDFSNAVRRLHQLGFLK